MLTCKQIAQLASESLDRDLNWRERLGIRFHYMMCRICPRYLRQLLFLRRAAADGEHSLPSSRAHLSDEARKRINDAVRRQLH